MILVLWVDELEKPAVTVISGACPRRPGGTLPFCGLVLAICLSRPLLMGMPARWRLLSAELVDKQQVAPPMAH